MDFMVYVLLPPESRVTLENVDNRLAKLFENDWRVSKSKFENERITYMLDDWTISVRYNNSPQVLQESKEIAEKFGNARDDKQEIAVCSHRLEISADSTPQVQYLNDFFIIVRTLSTCQKTKTFDRTTGLFFNGQ
jgi:hypothetical protein